MLRETFFGQLFSQVRGFNYDMAEDSVRFLARFSERDRGGIGGFGASGSQSNRLWSVLESVDRQSLPVDYLWRRGRYVSEKARGVKRSRNRFPAVGRICRSPSAAFAFVRTTRGMGGPLVQRGGGLSGRTPRTLLTQRH